VQPATRIYHLALGDEWREARGEGSYRRSTLGRSLDEEGFIHCSFADQVQATADRFYGGRNDVVLLEVDPARVRSEIRVENLDGGDVMFPHLYGPVPVAAVVRATQVERGADGRLLVEPLLDRPRDGAG
jgi:glutathione S-transferase